jgi:hypothetical protein
VLTTFYGVTESEHLFDSAAKIHRGHNQTILGRLHDRWIAGMAGQTSMVPQPSRTLSAQGVEPSFGSGLTQESRMVFTRSSVHDCAAAVQSIAG